MQENSMTNKMGTMPVGKLLMSMALPMMLSFFIQALYNIVDSMFVAQISENALTAVTLAYPMQQAMQALGVGTGIGMTATVSKAVGMKKKDYAETVTSTGIFLNLCYVVFFLVLAFTVSHAFFVSQTNVQEIVQDGTIYLRIIWIGAAADLFGLYFEKMLTAVGFATQAMVAQAVGAVFNIVFDPLLIFGIGPFPKMGIAGAAVATVLGLLLGAVLAAWMNFKKNKIVRVRLGQVFRPKGKAVKDIYVVGIPSMVTIGLSSLASFSINQILLAYSTTATAVYGIWMKLQNFCYMPAFGMNNGMVPIISYNYGAGKIDRVKKTVRLAITSIMGLEVVLLVIFECIPQTILTLFSASDNMMSIGVTALHVLLVSLVFGGGSIVLTSSMQSLGHARYTLMVNIMRNFVTLVSFFYIASRIFSSISHVWIAVPCSDVLNFILAVFLYRKMVRHLSALDKR